MENRHRRRRLGAFVAVAVAALCILSAAFTSAAPAATSHAAAAKGCHGLRLKGMTVRAAKARAARAHCTVRLRGAKIEKPATQTVAKQTARGKVVTLWVASTCQPELAPRFHPVSTPGPTELVSGLYAYGGRPPRPGEPVECQNSWAGTVTVTDPSTGAVVGSQTVEAGQLAEIPLPPGTYTATGIYLHVIVNNAPGTTFPETVTIGEGETVRQDLSRGFP
jgi:hypothetical protein